MLKSLSILVKIDPDNTMYLNLILLTNKKIDEVTYVQLASRRCVQLCQQKGRWFVNRVWWNQRLHCSSIYIDDAKLNPNV